MPTHSPLEKHLLHFLRLRDAAATLTPDQLDAAAYVLFGAVGHWTRDHVVAHLQGCVDSLTERLQAEQESSVVLHNAATGVLDTSRN